jgi:hypothetical protein
MSVVSHLQETYSSLLGHKLLAGFNLEARVSFYEVGLEKAVLIATIRSDLKGWIKR